MTDRGDIVVLEVMEDSESRRFERTDFKVRGFIGVENSEVPFSIVNISLQGILISPDRDLVLERNTAYPLRISLPHSEISIVTQAELMHREGGQFGFRFNLVEADGMIHLRRLLELNSGSEDSMEKELAFLVE